MNLKTKNKKEKCNFCGKVATTYLGSGELPVCEKCKRMYDNLEMFINDNP